MTAREDMAAVLGEVAGLRDELAALRDVVALFYEAGRADALAWRPGSVNVPGT